MARPVKGNADEIARRLADHNERIAHSPMPRGRFSPKYGHPSMRRFEQEGVVDEESPAPSQSILGGAASVLKLRDLVSRVLMELDDYAPAKAMEFRKELKGMK